MNSIVDMKIGCGGFYHLVARKRSPGGIILREREFGWMENLVTDYGLQTRANLEWNAARMCLGTGTAAPAPSDTRLDNFFTGTQTGGGTTHGAGGTSGGGPWYGWSRVVCTFNVGVFNNTIISEIGAALTQSNVTSSMDLISRSLIRDSNGDPTTIELAPDEELVATWEPRFYAPQGDVTVQDTIGGTLRDITIRACAAGSVSWRGLYSGSNAVLSGATVYSSNFALGAETGTPTGTSLGNVAQGSIGQTAAYVAGTTYRDLTMGRGTGATVDIGGFDFDTMLGRFQVQIDPPVEKLSTEFFRLTIRSTLGRP